MDNEPNVLKVSERDLIVAMHEAGHAVACCRLGVPFSHVSIDCDAGGVETEPVCRPQREAELVQYAQRCRAQVIVAFAGPLAELHAARTGLIRAVGFASGRKDERDARHFVREMIEARGEAVADVEVLPQILVGELGALCSEAEALVEAEFAVIESVAWRLAETGRMTCAEVSGIVG